MRRCLEMHILPKRCKRDTASCPGPHAGGEVISLVLREMQGPARDAWTLVWSSGRRRGDHVTRDSTGKLCHGYIIYRFILWVQSKEEALRDAIDVTEKCGVCLERASRRAQEGGRPAIWRQAEPCRHWTCDDCTRELIARGLGDTCILCKRPVISYAVGVAPSANQS